MQSGYDHDNIEHLFNRMIQLLSIKNNLLIVMIIFAKGNVT